MTEPADWLHQLYGDHADGWLTLFSIERPDGQRHIDANPADPAGQQQLAQKAGMRADKCCVWFGVATRREGFKGRGSAADCLQIPGLWLDVDIAGPNHKTTQRLPADHAAAIGILTRFPLPPTAIVDSGGGIQAWWLFDQPYQGPDITQTLEDWAYTWERAGHETGYWIDNVFDLARVMRLPGTHNRKTEPTPVTVNSAVWNRRYKPWQLQQILYTRPPPEQMAPRHVNVPYIGPARPGDAFNAVRTGSDVLALAGFVPSGTDHDGTHWTRPGKDPRQGSSATVYTDGHATIYSDTVRAMWPAVELRRPYDPFGLYAGIFHAGDYSAASDQLALEGFGVKAMPPDTTLLDDVQRRTLNAIPAKSRIVEKVEQPSIFLEWPAFWNQDPVAEDWLAYPILPRKRQVALYAPAKTGKSLLALDIAVALATGRKVLGGDRAQDGLVIVYLDYEMTEADLYERLEEMGYNEDDDMSRLRYALLPPIPALDTAAGGQQVLELALAEQADAVVIDTTSRAVQGDENEADTIRDFYRHTGSALKAHQIAMLRTDHAGKDTTKGQRGTSAKNDDVDVVWSATKIEGGLRLARGTLSRLRWVPETVELDITRDPLAHILRVKQDKGYQDGAREVAALLDDMGCDVDTSVRAAAKAFRAAGKQKVAQAILADAVRYRKSDSYRSLLDDAFRNTFRNTLSGGSAEKAVTDAVTVRNSPRNASVTPVTLPELPSVTPTLSIDRVLRKPGSDEDGIDMEELF